MGYVLNVIKNISHLVQDCGISIDNTLDHHIILRETRTTRTPECWDTPRHLMITHTSELHQIPSQNKTKTKLQILKKLPKIKIIKFCIKLYLQHTFWSCLIRCIDMKWIQPEM